MSVWNAIRAFVRDYRGLMLRREHDWREVTFGRRQCLRCGSTSLLMHRKFPQVDEATLSWSTEDTSCRP